MQRAFKMLLLLLVAAWVTGCTSDEFVDVAGGRVVVPPPVPPPAGVTLNAIAVTPDGVGVAPRQTQQFTATGTFSDGSTQNLTSQATWTSSDAAIGTVDPLGLATAVATGTTTLTATVGPISGSANFQVVGSSTITVNHILVAAKAIPANVTDVTGIGKTEQGAVVYSQQQPIAVQNVFTGIPISVTSWTLEYRANGTLVGTFIVAVTLTEGGNLVINDPDFTDAAPAATSLRFLKNPTNGIPGQTLVQVDVQVLDQFGNLFTTPVNVTLALGTNPAGATLAGTLTQASVNGLASFNDLSINVAGTGFQFLATAPTLANRLSQAFDVRSPDDPVDSGQSFLTFLYGCIPGVAVIVPPAATCLWDLDLGMSLQDGFEDTWDGAMDLSVGGVVFPGDQTYLGLTFLTPLLTPPGPGVGTQRPAVDGIFSAFFAPVSFNGISQTIDLTGSAPPINLTWTDEVLGGGTIFGSEPFNYQVVIRDTSGNLLATAFTSGGPFGLTNQTFNLDAFAGQTIVIAWEVTNYTPDDDEDHAQLDAVSILDGSGTERVTNGSFETGNLNGWTTTVNPQSQNIMSAARTVNGLDVTRTVYSRPDRPWMRYYDEFINNTGAPIMTTIEYRSNLGSDGDGVSVLVPNTGNRAVVSSDTDLEDGDSDLGFVFGSGATLVAFTPNTGNIDWDYTVTVNPGQTIAFCVFVLQDGQRSLGAFPTRLGNESVDIVTNFRRNPIFLDGLSAAQQARIQNL